MPRSKRKTVTLIFEIALLVIGAAGLIGMLLVVLNERKFQTWPWLLTSIFLIILGYILLHNRHSEQRLSRLATTYHFERSLYREALLANCDYAYTVNLTQNNIHAVHRVGMLHPYGFHPSCNYDEAIVAAMKGIAPHTLDGDKDIYLSQHYLDAYQNGKRVLYQEYHLKQDDTYKQKSVFLTKNSTTGELFAFIALHDVTERFRSKKKTQTSLRELTEAAKQIASGDLSVKINCDDEGDIGVLAQSMQRTADKLRIYIQSIQDLARKDSMTAMGNRTAYVGTIAELDVRLQKKEPLSFGVVMFDLEGLKRVNDVYGHSEGDRYIITASNLIREVFAGQKRFRIGGDEFVVILFDKTLHDLEDMISYFEQVQREYNKTARIKISISHGYAIYNPQKDTCFADVYARADAEMYASKKRRQVERS